MLDTYTIYMVVNKTNGMRYIGKTCLPLNIRLGKHTRTRGRPLSDAMWEFQWPDDFECYSLLEDIAEEDSFYWEAHYVIRYNTLYPRGYNLKIEIPYSIGMREGFGDYETHGVIPKLVSPETYNTNLEKHNRKMKLISPEHQEWLIRQMRKHRELQPTDYGDAEQLEFL